MMWFAKLFGGRRGHEDDDDRPTVAPAPAPETTTGSRTVTRPTSTTARRRQGDFQRKGFDPYNSGAFQRRNAWERVNRR